MEGSWQEAQAKAQQLREQAEEARQNALKEAGSDQLNSIEALARELDLEQSTLREAHPTIEGKIDDILVHRFGREIITNPNQTEAYLDLGKRIENSVPSRGKVPVIVITNIRSEFDEPAYETAFVVVDPNKPFYSHFEVHENQRMHAFTDEKADVVHAEAGLVGKAVKLDGNMLRPSTAGNRSFPVKDNFMLSSIVEATDGSGRGFGGTYQFSDSDTELVPEVSDEHHGNENIILVGWEEIRTALLEIQAHDRSDAAQYLFYLARNADTWPTRNSSKLMNQIFSTFVEERRAQDSREALLRIHNI